MLEDVKAKILLKTARILLITKKYSPEILVGIGTTSMIGCAIFAHESKPKAMEVMNEHTHNMEEIEKAKNLNMPEKYNDEDYKKDKKEQVIRTTWGMIKVYAPAAITGVLGVTSILCGFGIIKKRNLAIIGAYKLISKSYDDYRGRVVAKYGAEEDRCFKNGITKAKEFSDNPDAQVVETDMLDPSEFSAYCKFFDESSVHWSKEPGYNFYFVQSQQDYANDLLATRGHVFLNDVYDVLGIPRTSEGSIVGWLKGGGDGFIDFGIFNNQTRKVRDFVNGHERNILLDFNVQGIVYNLI